ncbi:hypothetical protein NPIL_562461 [Nephila pilipes]|uniref:Uncharacterized protein n=1 Tax=Nephila pilipes TaxID=299642 RepID=A0A8X6NHV7_NEPPI|nr:hypothetical protein NPIL_562461 [Nephila pilipes]
MFSLVITSEPSKMWILKSYDTECQEAANNTNTHGREFVACGWKSLNQRMGSCRLEHFDRRKGAVFAGRILTSLLSSASLLHVPRLHSGFFTETLSAAFFQFCYVQC